MRRTLLALQARTDACRTIGYHTALLLDESEQHRDADARRRAADAVALLTPVVKALFTELGHRGADEALQVWGGYGFVHDYGIEQTVRDSRIALIYEGTNEIQAIDLLLRKVLDDGGQRSAALRAGLAADAGAAAGVETVAPFAQALDAQLAAWTAADVALLDGRAADTQWPLRVADDYLFGVGHALMAWAWLRLSLAATRAGDATISGARPAAHWLAVARFGVDWLLPQAQVHWQRVLRRDAELPLLPG
jgi:hypothetical protein